MTYHEFIKDLHKNEHFERLMNDVEEHCTKNITSSNPEDKEKRENAYFELRGVRAIRNKVGFLSKMKSLE